MILDCPLRSTESNCSSAVIENDEVTHFASNTPNSSCNIQVKEDQTGSPRENQESCGNPKFVNIFLRRARSKNA